MSDTQERIIRAAIMGDHGRPWHLPQPRRHHDVIAYMANQGVETPIVGEQGFITNNGRFVGRKEALAIATAAGQIITKHGNPDELFSEDVW